MKTKTIFGSALVLMLGLFSSSYAVGNTSPILQEPTISRFIDKMVKEHQFKRDDLHDVFQKVERLPDVVERMTKPAESLPWHRYRKIFIQESRIQQGVEFWKAHAETLSRAERKYGVPAEIIVAIIGVETRFGQHKGGFRVLDSLATLAVDYPRRSQFFTKEMEEFLLLTRDEGLDPLSIMGSYAGAMGKPQFIASSYRRYAIDFNGDGVRDLFNTDDAIGSVANYLSRHGWNRDKPIAAPAQVSGSKYQALVKKGYKPSLHVREVEKHGVKFETGLSENLRAALLEFEQEDGHEYWVGLDNFYVITRYNHSPLYAMAVFQLAESISAQLPALASND